MGDFERRKMGFYRGNMSNRFMVLILIKNNKLRVDSYGKIQEKREKKNCV